MKQCSRCGLVRPIEMFGADRYRKDGRTIQCRECRRALGAAYRMAHPDKIKAQNARPRHRGAGAGQKAWAQRNPARIRVLARAGEALRRAVRRGLIVRPDRCEQCSTVGVVEGAHYDYSKPLDVRWLCRKCHRAWDREQPKSAALSTELTVRMRPGPKPAARSRV